MDAFLEKALAERPVGDGTRQALHVVALVEKGDWLTLADYKDSFPKSQVLNFVSKGAGAVTFDILNLAFSAALDVAFPDYPPAPDKFTPEAVNILQREPKYKRRPRPAVLVEDPLKESQPPRNSVRFRLGRAVARLWPQRRRFG